ncbi:LptF/LptG family permease [Candidatus Liberibacter africanus]|uniref:Putative permease n=2 Tax=Liberibacter africanus TaxID=34020 RepID=A0A0G3I8B0_LIBAF|nr:LptF/LptG family permease [Candidatus Liberibacter africanus]AKK19947.1 putative permease [Candidatus Liberibacter africanus PTSAPSY]
MPGILWKYFFKYYLKNTLYFLLAITVLIFVIDLNEIQTRMGGLPKYETSWGIILVFTRVPLIIQQVIPFIILVANIVVFFRLNKTNELIVSRAIGISIWQLLAPFATGSFLIGIFIILFVNPISITGEKIGNNIIEQWQNNDNKKSKIIPWAHLKNPQQEIFVGAKKIIPGKNILKDVSIITVDKKSKIIHRQDAHHAIINNNEIYLKDVFEYQYDTAPIFRESMVLNIPIKINGFQKISEQFLPYSFYDIVKKIIFYNESNVFLNHRLETQFYFLISIPFMLVAMTLIAASVSLDFNRSNQPRIIIAYGIFAGVMLYTIITLMKSLGKNGTLLPYAAALIPIVSTVSLSILILLKKEDG